MWDGMSVAMPLALRHELPVWLNHRMEPHGVRFYPVPLPRVLYMENRAVTGAGFGARWEVVSLEKELACLNR